MLPPTTISPFLLALTLLAQTSVVVLPVRAEHPPCKFGTSKPGLAVESGSLCKQRNKGPIWDCGKGTTVTVKQSRVVLRTGTQDSTVLVNCGAAWKSTVLFCPSGVNTRTHILECKEQLNAVYTYREVRPPVLEVD